MIKLFRTLAFLQLNEVNDLLKLQINKIFKDVEAPSIKKPSKKEGEVIEIDRANNRAKVKEINMVKKHVKTTKEKKGGIFSKEGFIHLSNLKLIDEKAEKKKEAKK